MIINRVNIYKKKYLKEFIVNLSLKLVVLYKKKP